MMDARTLVRTKRPGRSSPDAPLEIAVTAAGRELLVLRALARQAIPMLLTPERYGGSARRQLAGSLQCATGPAPAEGAEEPPFSFRDEDAPPEDDDQEGRPGFLRLIGGDE